LLRFEEDLSYLTSAVVIFLEAPGAIAELGAFSQIAALRERLVVVVGDHHHEKRSFISLGPLRQLDRRENDHVCVIPNAPAKKLPEDLPVVLRNVAKKIKAAIGGRAFDPKDRGHQFALALDLISLIEVMSFKDVKAALSYFGVISNETSIRQLLFTLLKAKLIQTHRYGGTNYYLPIQRRQKWVDYRGPTATAPFNRPRVTARILGRRKFDDDRHRVHELVFTKAGQRW
jgi:hypothetical protein